LYCSLLSQAAIYIDLKAVPLGHPVSGETNAGHSLYAAIRTKNPKQGILTDNRAVDGDGLFARLTDQQGVHQNMNLMQSVWLKLGDMRKQRGAVGFLMALAFMLMPSFALAGEGDVKLTFTSSDKIYLYVSLGFAVLALAVAFILIKMTMSVNPGSEKMQAVSQAIKEGAMAYLGKQIKTMTIFIVILAIGLFFLYQNQYSSVTLGLAIAGCFVLGVAASYIAGLTGMIMAVNGNTRTAASALTSYKKALETAFRAGSVAGMVTVGLGLLGATIIFLTAGENAMKLLVGFGFGGSLAALFMRVGGGIFTKAADVGADLVGKVEAGIPEDDPRNPATIADNVGDNVGDCAGMAADVFESYEVTLVAAIILGSATMAIFDAATAMKLILFALMARGVGVIASIIGIFCVRGTDDVDKDPLFPIRRGFWISAGFAALATLGLGMFMMKGLKTTTFTSYDSVRREALSKLFVARDRVAKETKTSVDEVKIADVIKQPEVVAAGFGPVSGDEDQTKSHERYISQVLTKDLSELTEPKSLDGFQKVDLTGDSHVLDYATPVGGATPITIKQKLTDDPLLYYHLQITITRQPVPGQPSVKSGKNVEEIFLGPMTAKEYDQRIGSNKQPGIEIKKINTLPVNLYANAKGDLALGIDGNVDTLRAQSPAPINYFKVSPEEYMASMTSQNPKPIQMKVIGTISEDETRNFGFATERPVDWWRFPLCIVFGILMAFLIEILTDYYVSLHKKPVQEVAANSTTGPATMIITGMAYGMESSVFSVFAIVIALMAPILIFPPAEFGGYLLSFYGIALVGLGLLTTTGFILAMDTFGPISDNAQGVYEMSGEGEDNEYGSKAVQRLDAAGNTTKALTKGFAIATAVVAAVALFHSYLEEAQLSHIGLRLEIPEIFLGLLIGGAAPYLFSAFSINAVGRAAFKLINEVRDQFRNDPGIMAGTSKPNYGRCVAIVTQAAQQELLGPGVLAIALPAAVAFGFSIGKPTIGGLNLTGAQALGGYLAGAILSGQLMAVLLSNSGGIWDNAKKYIEDGAYGGKGSEAHKAGVVCDTVGDPFKDTAGPALNPLIKVMNLVALLLAPVVIRPLGTGVLVAVTLVCVGALAFSVYWSKRGSMAAEIAAAAKENE